MICPNCQIDNPENARFCINCGQPFAPAGNCPNCGAPIVPGAKFCYNCGHALSAVVNPPLENQLQKYIPRELLIKLQAAQAGRAMEGERRIVTMLFCDVKGSTAMAENLDPEEWAEIMNGAFAYLIPPLFRYEGTIPRMMGDAILGFFGAPIAHEDDPERAVRAGLEMIEGIREYNERIQRERGLDFEVRVGINTGLVVVGGVGTDLRLEYTAMGDAINLAARMEQTAQPGTVQITEHTYRLVAPIFDVEPLGGITVKGKSEPVEAYRVVGLKAAATRLYGIEGIETPLVGREKEMRQLHQKIEEVRHGQGGILCLTGEAGLGKSRLIQELKHEWERSFLPGPAGAWDAISQASFAASRPYGQFRQHLLEHMGIRETDPPKAVIEKIRQVFKDELAELLPQAISVYSRLLGIEEPGNNPIEGEAFKQELFDLVLSFEQIWMGEKPAVQVFDDMQWIDPASAELLVHLLQLTREKSILYVCAFRPEPDSPAWKFKQIAETEYASRYTEIMLEPLPVQDSRALISHLLSGANPSPQLTEQILVKAEGNPFFMEEVVRELLDRGLLKQGPEGLSWRENREPEEIAIPESLHALFLARLDQLEEDARRTLQLAAVIGRSFYYRVLKVITEAAIELDRELKELQDIDLIYENARQPELEYQFRHALTQEAAYRSILVKRRREYHRCVAEALETLFSNRLEDHADLLAHHFDAAGDGRARHYYQLAGNNAAKIYAVQEAIAYYSRALEIPGEISPEERISLLEARGEIYFSLGHFEQASADFEAALQEARRNGLPGVESRILANLAWLRWSSGRGAEALELAREAEARALASSDYGQTQRASIIVGSALQNAGDIPGARLRFRQALFASRRQDMQSLSALSLYNLAILENFAGRFGRAAVCAQTAHQMYLRLGDRRRACGALFYESLAEGGRGRYDQALTALEEGRRLAEQISSPFLARYPNQRAWLSAELGDWETAYEIDLAGLHPAQAVPGFREIEISTLINLVLDCTALGRLEEAEKYLAESQIDLGRPEFGSHNWRWSLRLADAQARIELAHRDTGRAAESIELLLAEAKRLVARKYTARGLVLRAQVFLAKEEFPPAEADLQATRRLADSLCYMPVRLEARQLLSRLYQQTGSAELAERQIAEISDLAGQLDSQIRRPELRDSFERGIRKKLAKDSGGKNRKHVRPE